MDNDDPVQEASDQSAAAPLREQPAERDAGHSQRLNRMRFVQPSIHQEDDGAEEHGEIDDPTAPEDGNRVDQAGQDPDDSDVSIVYGGDSSDEPSSNSSENGLDDSDADRLFDDYIHTREQQQSTVAEIYNTELPTEHAVSG